MYYFFEFRLDVMLMSVFFLILLDLKFRKKI